MKKTERMRMKRLPLETKLMAKRWERIELTDTGRSPPNARFLRLFVRREGHATFRLRVMGLRCACDEAPA